MLIHRSLFEMQGHCGAEGDQTSYQIMPRLRCGRASCVDRLAFVRHFRPGADLWSFVFIRFFLQRRAAHARPLAGRGLAAHTRSTRGRPLSVFIRSSTHATAREWALCESRIDNGHSATARQAATRQAHLSFLPSEVPGWFRRELVTNAILITRHHQNFSDHPSLNRRRVSVHHPALFHVLPISIIRSTAGPDHSHR